MFNLIKITELKTKVKTLEILNNTNTEKLKKYCHTIACKDSEIERLEKELKEAKDLSSILNRIGEIGCTTFNKLASLNFTNSCGTFNELVLPDNIPQYVEDIFDNEKKVIKQESNLGIIIDKEGEITTGRTKLPCDKNKNYKLKQI